MLSKNLIEPNPGIYVERPVVGITSPEFQHFTNEVVKAIGRMTQRLFKGMKSIVVGIYRYLQEQNRIAGEIHNRVQASKDERFARNYFPIRMV